MQQRRFISLWLALLVFFAAAAQQPSFTLVPVRNVVEGRNFALTFRLTNAEANAPAAPQLENCKLLFGPSTSTMQSTQIINGQISTTSSVDYTYTYRAESAGVVHVPAIKVNASGRELSSSAATFKILPADRSSQPGGSHVEADNPASQTPGEVSADDLMVRVSFSKNSVYEQEPVVATVKIYTKYDITSFMVTTQPAFEGFLSEEIPVTYETSMEHYNGRNYNVAVVKRLLLYPQRAGKLTVNSGKYDVTVVQYETVNMGFFRTARPIERQVTTSSNAASINVVALPEPKPAGFTGAVGSFTVETSLEPELLRTNEAAVYSYIVKGRGNIKFLTEPVIQFPGGIDTYTPKTDIDASVVGGGTNMAGTFRTDITFVPQEVGNFAIAGTPFAYFDLDSKSYRTIDVPSMPIKVLRGNNASPVVQNTADIDNVIDDILHIKPSDGRSRTAEPSYTFTKFYYWLGYVIVVLALVAFTFIYRRNIRLKADVSGRRLARASRVAGKRLKEARGYMERHENDAFYAALARALWGYISDKLSIPSSQLTRDNVLSKLDAYGLDAESGNRVVDVLDRCEMARFTPTHSDDEVADMYRLAEEAVNSIENVRRR